MAGASDKARFYLEQSVPELQELIRKELFTKDEVNSIVKRRSGYEHKLNARGSTASDYARYAEYEMNLDSLRKTRARRLGIRSRTYAGQRRILFIFDRATKKFHGDTALWLQYLAFARKQKSNKRVSRIMTDMLRLHPTDPQLWIYAANHALDERGDAAEARTLMQRGLRFCNRSTHLWSAYLKLEMIYIAKIAARRQVLGLDRVSARELEVPANDDLSGDMIPLPPADVEDMKLECKNHARAESPDFKATSMSALNGAIPIAVFDAAMKQSPSDASFGAELFDIVAAFPQLECTKRILKHIVTVLMTVVPNKAQALRCSILEPVFGVDAASFQFPGLLAEMLDRHDSAMRTLDALEEPQKQTQARTTVSWHMIKWAVPLFEATELDADIRAVLTNILQTSWDQYMSGIRTENPVSRNEVMAVLELLRIHGFEDLAQSGLASALQKWPTEPRLLALKASSPP
ncbi:MAG: hypothetical protein Q9183_000055 [Haloplaca sp. 2 TL-2023]